MKKIPKQEYTTEFKEHVVKHVKTWEVDWRGSEGTGAD